ncbi:hypothetical protein Lsai_2346 [Legionella sainthelensi]|uniref:Uncharacterized protein n=1 Tax=Legionella sainthelensi TaxID=28087 RepID=A0A0W0YFM0_9GAMM|nr:ElyC/SanA/YdcF family protein [Legionella sainthelensi]KTD55487.1 hypothetical protein Lsai_2346 [Legionella sainthelensi]VEH37500.1 Uncharacterised protein [Legionella sainthelensi]
MFFKKRSLDNKSISDWPNFNKYYPIKKYPEAMSFITLLHSKTNEEEFLTDASKLIKFLAPPLAMIKKKQGNHYKKLAIENTIDFLVHDYPENIPDVIFIPGNNDLSQLDDLVHTLFLLKKKLINNNIESAEEIITSIPIVISGKGGHGVTAGPIFATTEAEALHYYLKKRLLYGKSGLKNQIYLEKEAENTGANIDFTKPIMRQIARETQKEEQGLNVWLVPTPVGGMRQLFTVSKQSGDTTMKGGEGYNLHQVYILPDRKRIIHNYFNINNQEESGINFFAALRETVNYVNYMLNNDFMSPNAPDPEDLKEALTITFKYYKRLTKNKITREESIIEAIIKFSQLKEAKGGMSYFREKDKPLINFIKENMKPITQYFLNAFKQIERQHMEYLPEKLGLKNKGSASQSLLHEQEIHTKQYSAFFHSNYIIDDLPYIENELAPT